MLSPRRSSYLIAAMLLTAGFTQAAAISVNGTCELGNCSTPGTLSPGQSIGTTSFGFTYVLADTDRFFVSGTYSASGNAPRVAFSATASFLGNSTNTTSGADKVSVDLLQMFGYAPDATYQETATLAESNIAPGSNVTAELSFDGQGIGLLGPYSGTASQTFSATKDLAGLGIPALADFNYTFNLAAGSPAVPEPANVGLSLVGLLSFFLLIVYRKRVAGSYN